MTALLLGLKMKGAEERTAIAKVMLAYVKSLFYRSSRSDGQLWNWGRSFKVSIFQQQLPSSLSWWWHQDYETRKSFDSSKSGSADVLEALGINFILGPEDLGTSV